MKNGVFWVVTQCGSCKNLVFLRSVRRLLVAACVVPSSPIFCHLYEGGARFLRNVGSYKSHTALQPRRHHSSTLVNFVKNVDGNKAI
jgi:hypothetical protein